MNYFISPERDIGWREKKVFILYLFCARLFKVRTCVSCVRVATPLKATKPFTYAAHVLHTARISNDERVLYNDIETLMVMQLSYLLGSYVTQVLTVFKLRILRAAR